MTTFLGRAGAVLFSMIAMFSFLLGIVALVGLGRPDRMAVYLAATIISVAIVAWLMRADRRRERAKEAARRPVPAPAPRRTPRRPITFPLKETTLTFAFWYAAAAVIDRVVNGYTSPFTLEAIAPFASFMLTTLTIAGRHIAFRLTAEEDDAGPSDTPRI
ncbi:MAG: hypothetical protein KGJ98_02835 [Chloroflexota bacterium]|nr:hypothetical protein [Chloroflexota bacterium]MDE3101152.1 hypothetical protein [Chloroflexota bacterium]